MRRPLPAAGAFYCVFCPAIQGLHPSYFDQDQYMKNFKSLLAASLFASASSMAFADLYSGVDYAFIDAGDIDLGAVALKGGYQINEWAAVEARVGFGVDDDKIGGAKAELNHFYGAYVVAGLPNSSIVLPYAIVGYTKGEVEARFAGVKIKSDGDDWSYGVGARVGMSDRLSANFEFIRYADKNDAELDAVNIGLVYKY